MPTMSRHEQGEQVAVAGHAQGEVGDGEQQIVADEAQHGGQDGGTRLVVSTVASTPARTAWAGRRGQPVGRGARPRPRSHDGHRESRLPAKLTRPCRG